VIRATGVLRGRSATVSFRSVINCRRCADGGDTYVSGSRRVRLTGHTALPAPRGWASRHSAYVLITVPRFRVGKTVYARVTARVTFG